MDKNKADFFYETLDIGNLESSIRLGSILFKELLDEYVEIKNPNCIRAKTLLRILNRIKELSPLKE